MPSDEYAICLFPPPTDTNMDPFQSIAFATVLKNPLFVKSVQSIALYEYAIELFVVP